MKENGGFFSRTKHSRAFTIAAVCVIAAVLVYALLYISLLAGTLKLPENISNFILGRHTKGNSGEMDRIYALLSGARGTGAAESYEMTPEAVVPLVSSLREPETYYRKSTVTYRSGASRRDIECIVYKSGEKMLLQLSEPGEAPYKTVVHSGKRTRITYNGTGDTTVFEDVDFSYSAETGICSVKDFTDDLFGDEENVPESVDVARSYSGTGLVLTYTYAPLGLRDVYEISLEYGVCLAAFSYENGELVYSLKTESFVVLDSLSDTLFAIDG